jgi:hypothetical protein
MVSNHRHRSDCYYDNQPSKIEQTSSYLIKSILFKSQK